MTSKVASDTLRYVDKLEKKVPRWEKRLALFLEIFIAVSGIYQTFFGDLVNGILALICLALIVFPKFFTRNLIKWIPIEIEILLFIIVLLQYILGEIHDFYTTIPYYDKLVHFTIPLFIGLIGFLIAYTMYATGRLKASGISIIIIVSLLSLGIGAIWEIIEFFSDSFLYPSISSFHHFQGNSLQSANTDTMTDLINDLLGGVVGGILGLWFMEKGRYGKNTRAQELTKELSAGLFGK